MNAVVLAGSNWLFKDSTGHGNITVDLVGFPFPKQDRKDPTMIKGAVAGLHERWQVLWKG